MHFEIKGGMQSKWESHESQQLHIVSIAQWGRMALNLRIFKLSGLEKEAQLYIVVLSAFLKIFFGLALR